MIDFSRSKEGKILSEIPEGNWITIPEKEKEVVKERVEIIGKLLGLDQEKHGNILKELQEGINKLETTNYYENEIGDYSVHRMRLDKVIGKYKNAFYDLQVDGERKGKKSVVNNPQLLGEELSFIIASAISEKHFDRIRKILPDYTPLQLPETDKLSRSFERMAHIQDFTRLVEYLSESEIDIGVRVVGGGENLFRKIGGNLSVSVDNVLTKVGIGMDRFARNFKINPRRRSYGEDLEIAIILPKDVQIIQPKR